MTYRAHGAESNKSLAYHVAYTNVFLSFPIQRPDSNILEAQRRAEEQSRMQMEQLRAEHAAAMEQQQQKHFCDLSNIRPQE
jgi:hypothetical protein